MPDSAQTAAPFVGRDTAFVRLHQHILNPATRHAMIYIGRDGIGKTRFLRHFNVVFDESHPGVYIPLRTLRPETGADLLRELAQETTQHIQNYFYSPIALPIAHQELDTAATKQWFTEVYLPAVLQIVRADRHLIWLIDDVEVLLAAEAELASFLYQLLQQHSALTIVLTLNLKYETRLSELTPLIDVTQVERLASLSEAETETLIRHFVGDISEADVPAIYQATGGHPRFVASFGRELAKLHDIHGDIVRQVMPTVGSENAQYLEALWQGLAPDERLVLNAVSSLYYDDPLRVIAAEDIETWLLETDFPMDITTIRVTLRGLTYQEIVAMQGGTIQLTTGLLQKWLIENAHLDDLATKGNATLGRSWLIVALVIMGILIVILFSQPAPSVPDALVQPTVTLASN